MGLARTLAVTLTGLAGHIVDVEAHAVQGLPGFTLVGLPDAAVRESRERVRAALSTCGVTWGEQRLTVNLSPADLRKTGTGLDLALALLPGLERGRTGIGQLLGVVTAQYARAQAEGWAPPLGEECIGWLGFFQGSSQAAKYARTLKEMGQ